MSELRPPWLANWPIRMKTGMAKNVKLATTLYGVVRNRPIPADQLSVTIMKPNTPTSPSDTAT